MRFSLTIPTTLATRWQAASDTRLVTAGMAIRYGALVPLPDDPQSWMEATLRADAAGDVALGGVSEQATAKGWPMRLIGARVVAGTSLVEVRLGAFYKFFEYGAAAVAYAGGPAPADELAREALEIFATAEPDWSAEVVAVHQLWEGVESWRMK